MRYFYQDGSDQRVGPYSKDELRQLHLSGAVRSETLVIAEGSENAVPFRELWTQWKTAPDRTRRTAAGGTAEEVRAPGAHLLLPFKEVQSFNWLKNRKLIAIAVVGLVPLFIYATTPDLRVAFWGMAFYFSALWALFFYHVFPTPEARVSTCALCFFATGVLSISVLLLAYHIPPLSWLVQGFKSPNLFNHMLAFIFAIGLPEELCKALPLFVLLRKADPLPPQVMLFYGLMSGLGFGIYEGVDYQMGRNFRYASSGGDYYLLNLVRLTTLPFLHAMWLILIGVGVPALLHGLYNTFNQSIIGLGFALLTVLALNVYLARSVEFEEALIEKNLSEMP